MNGDTAESAAAMYAAGLFDPYAPDWAIEPITNGAGERDGWKATRREGAGQPMTVVRDTPRELANRLAEEERAAQLREEFARDPGGR